MSDAVIPSPEALLRLVAAASPAAWFPSEFAQSAGLRRDPIDATLNDLRVAGFVQISDWVKGRGQGYHLTQAGRDVLESPAMLAKVNAGKRVRVVERLRDDPPAASTTFSRGEAVRGGLVSDAPATVTRWLFVLNVLVFAAGLGLAVYHKVPLNQFVSHSTQPILVQTGAIHGSLLVDGDWWRLLTSCFVHIGFLHLAINMYSLILIGPLAERLWGHTRFAVLYILAGLGGSWAAMMYDPNVLVAGASGAIWGVLASLIAWVTLNRAHLPPQLIAVWLRRLLGVLLLNVFISMMPNISASGHFGGGAVGFLVAAMLNFHRFGSPRQKSLAVAVLAALPALFVLTLAQRLQ